MTSRVAGSRTAPGSACSRLPLAVAFVIALAALAGACRDTAPPAAVRGTVTSADAASASAPAAGLAALVPEQPPSTLDAARAAEFLALPLACVDRPWPNKPSHVYDDAIGFLPPEAVTPAFSGCFDWHSAVHGHWSLVRLLRRFPDLPRAAEARAALARRLTPAHLAAEAAFFAEERSRTFERPYGWGWLLRLQAELEGWDDPQGRAAAAAVRPLAQQLGALLRDYLDRLSLPIRAGTHANTAYALAHALDYARAVGDAPLAAAIETRARAFYGADRDCPTDYEPSGEDFLSPCLAEADLLRRVLAPEEFVRWLDGFLPAADSPAFRPLLAPPEVRDRKDPRIGHLIGLSFHRAGCFEGIARALPPDDPRGPLFVNLARLHVADGLRQMMDSGYGGEHWLASFAIIALTE